MSSFYKAPKQAKWSLSFSKCSYRSWINSLGDLGYHSDSYCVDTWWQKVIRWLVAYRAQCVKCFQTLRHGCFVCQLKRLKVRKVYAADADLKCRGFLRKWLKWYKFNLGRFLNASLSSWSFNGFFFPSRTLLMTFRCCQMPLHIIYLCFWGL